MKRDATYRWLRPSKAFKYYLYGKVSSDEVEALEWARQQVISGNIRVHFDGIIITPLIARLILEYDELRFPENRCNFPLPSDFGLNRPDIERLLKGDADKPTKRSGRPKGAGSLEARDLDLVNRMNQMISGFGRENTPGLTGFETAKSPTEAARLLVQQGQVTGGGTHEAKVKRLVKRYLESFGDDG